MHTITLTIDEAIIIEKALSDVLYDTRTAPFNDISNVLAKVKAKLGR